MYTGLVESLSKWLNSIPIPSEGEAGITVAEVLTL